MSKDVSTNKFNDLFKNTFVRYFTYGSQKQVNKTLKNHFKDLEHYLGENWNLDKNKSISLNDYEYYDFPINPLNQLFLRHRFTEADKDKIFFIYLLSDHIALKEDLRLNEKFNEIREEQINDNDSFRNWYLVSDVVYKSLTSFHSEKVLNSFLLGYFLDVIYHGIVNKPQTKLSDSEYDSLNALKRLMIVENLPDHKDAYNAYKQKITESHVYKSHKTLDKNPENYIRLSRLTMENLLEGLSEDTILRLSQLLNFISVTMPLGILGYYLILRINKDVDEKSFAIRYHQNYIIQSLYDYNIIDLVIAIENKFHCKLTVIDQTQNVQAKDKYNESKKTAYDVYPLEIRISRQNGRVHLIYYNISNKSLGSIRVDYIDGITIEGHEKENDVPLESINKAKSLTKYLWGVDTGSFEGLSCNSKDIKTVRITFKDSISVDEIRSQMRIGHIVSVDPLILEIQCLAPRELKPWVRRYYGFIENIEGMEPFDFKNELTQFYQLYHGQLPLEQNERTNPVPYEDIVKDTGKSSKEDAFDCHGALFHSLFSYSAIDYANQVFNDSSNAMYRYLKADRQNLSYLHDILPITLLEARYLKTILMCDKAQVFLSKEEIDHLNSRIDKLAPDTINAFPTDCFVYYDEVKDNDHIMIDHKKDLQLLIREIVKGHHEVLIEKQDHSQFVMKPMYLEYRLIDHTFTLIGLHDHEKAEVQLGDINKITVQRQTFKHEELPHQWCKVTLSFYNMRGIPDRLLNEISFLKKECKKDGERYILDIYFEKKDENELALRLLSFGPLIEIVDKQDCTIKERIMKRLQ